MTPSSSLRDRVLAGVARQPSRTRGEGRRRAAVLFGAALVAAASPLMLHDRFHVDDAAVAVGGLFVAFASAMFSLGRGSLLVGHSSATLFAVAVLAPIARLAWLERWQVPGTDAVPLWACFARTTLSSAPLFCAAWLVKTRSIIDHPLANGAALGTTAACFGAVIADLSCARGDDFHLVVGHVAPVVLAALVGTAAGRLLAVRSLDPRAWTNLRDPPRARSPSDDDERSSPSASSAGIGGG